ncbi:MAG: Methylated-DNA--protein-cysteine methyltransferase [Pseudolabrys sp.]|jgi:methylated-DNA-[protein]-cysteine S-methyltransferase|nr:Methylated-DNA--protein-cysteine methyltransferase [Pseudolabrys sp.]
MTYAYKTVLLPVGNLKLVASEAGLAAVLWPGDDSKRVRLPALAPNAAHPVLLDAERQLRDYFAGRRRTFTVPLDMAGTPFQQAVWQALLTIPYGETRSYSELARQIGRPEASRAVGAANGRNPVSIIVPCHRAIGADGSLTGFAGGLDVKRYLLNLEGAQLPAAA